MGQDVDPERATEIVEEFKREKRTRFQDQDIRDAMERAQKRQRTEEEEAALLLLRNGGDMEAAAQMLSKIRFD
jgi:ABC-type enterochelin transport system substrate-binding protein